MNIQTSEYQTNFNMDFIERTLIDIACCESGMLENNLICSRKEFFNFTELNKGIPITIPFIPFILKSNNFYELSISEFGDTIFGNNSIGYIGTKLSYKTSVFVSKYRIKNIFRKIINDYKKDILKTKIKISELKDKFVNLGAFQTRNIPHHGHEKIIEMMLEHCNAVVINPIIGPKKPGDIKTEKLKYIYESILKPRFNNRIFFIPIRANMFYAGPREAIHHSYIREWLGFSHFSVGRDHAGSDNFYKPDEAIKIFKNKKFSINILKHNGAFFCKLCNKTLLKGSCNHNRNIFVEISGSRLRYLLKNRKNYEFVSDDVQEWASKNFKSLF